ncbi:uncharacterized protein LOC116293542 [Actinia tenebrosa]|uniref:Uncharacterized protein LOC116293542 n=1 Tax=Actinia tenebrosa TaxID=6105 RepID=A0A6P8HKE5_ACTTE|nr:uncharacterized protein LOC116293542 [Actinia tenebrosa]
MSSRRNLLFIIVFILNFLVNKMANSEDICLLPPETGFCRAMIPRWYYQPDTGKCKRFTWGGCPMGSNDNRFELQSQCIDTCGALSCSKKYQALGCYANQLFVSDQPLGIELLNERDMENKAFNGTLIDWLRWNQYLPSLLCRCAERASGHGYETFAIHNFGVCWGIKEHQANMLNKTGQCWDRFYGQQCSSIGDFCTGGPSTYYYYKLT